MTNQVHLRPIIESGALEFPIVEAEAKAADQVQSRPGCRTEPGHVARIRRYFRFPQRNVKHQSSLFAFWPEEHGHHATISRIWDSSGLIARIGGTLSSWPRPNQSLSRHSGRTLPPSFSSLSA